MALIKCTECGQTVSDKASACPNCGYPISQIEDLFCEECGTQIPLNVSECPNCGCPIESVEVIQEEVMGEESKKSKTWIWILVVALPFLIGGGGYYAYTKLFNGESDKDAIVELTPEFIKAIEKYDQLGAFNEGYAAVRKGDKWGYINTKGEEVIPTTIDAYCAGRFSEGLAFVAHGKDADFSVIDIKGDIVFQAKQRLYFDSDIPESAEMPYFKNGKLYVTTLINNEWKYQVYDTNGKMKVDEKYLENINQQDLGMEYIVFADDSTNLFGGDEIDRSRLGIKDSKGNVLVSPKYNTIDGTMTDEGEESKLIANVSNGVVLVVLEEPDEDYYTELGGKMVNHYGYADLKGNDTFSEQLKSLCQRAEQKAIQKV